MRARSPSKTGVNALMGAFGDGFYIANHGSVRVDGESSSTMVGLGADGLMINFGVVESNATNSSVIAIDGNGSQFINAGQVISNADGVAVARGG